MTAKEMYIKVTNDLQAIGSQRSRKYYPEQIELEINTEIENFVSLALQENDRGFYTIDTQYFDAIQPLMVQKWLPIYISSGNYFTDMDLNYNRILESGIEDSTKCRAVDSSDFTPVKINYLVVSPKPSSKTTGPYYTQVNLTVNGISVYNRDSENGYPLKDLNYVIDELTNALPDLSWENSVMRTKAGNLVLRVKGDTVSAQLSLDGQTQDFLAYSTDEVNEMKPGNKDMYSLIPVRRIKNQNITDVLSTAYYKPSYIDIPATLSSYRLNLYTPKNLIVNDLFISYIRKPRRISLSLNVGSDLSPNIHGIICDRTVQRIRERIGDPKYQTGILQERITNNAQ